VKEITIRLLGTVLPSFLHRVTQTADEFRGKLWFGCSELGEVVLAIQELLEVVLDGVGIQCERILALSLFGRVPSIKGPISSIDSQFRLLQDLESRSVLCEIGKVGKDDTGTVELVRLDQRLEHLRVGRVYSDACDINIAVVHRVQSNILFAAMRVNSVAGGVGSGVENEDVDVQPRSDEVVNPGRSNVIRPRI
jgi:hypothetical protein